MGLRCMPTGAQKYLLPLSVSKISKFYPDLSRISPKKTFLYSCLFGETCQNWIQFPVTMRLLWGRSLRVPVLAWLGTFCYRCVSDQEQGNSCNKGTPKADHVLLSTTVNSSSSEISTINQKKKKKDVKSCHPSQPFKWNTNTGGQISKVERAVGKEFWFYSWHHFLVWPWFHTCFYLLKNKDLNNLKEWMPLAPTR